MFVSTVSLGKKRKEVDALEAEWLVEVGEYDRSGDWAIDGYLSAAAALRVVCRMDAGVAQHYVHLARKLAKLPDVAAAYLAGDLSLRHVQAITDAYTSKRADGLAAAASSLVDVAGAHTPKEVGAVVRCLTDAIDGDDGATTDEDEFDARRFYASKTLRGQGDLRGSCDPLSFEIVEQALDAEMARDLQAADRRSKPVRRMDALTNLCRRALGRGEVGETHGVQPHVSAVVHIDPTGDAANAARAEYSRGGHLSTNLLEVLLCDCTLSRIVVAGKSEILDVGRATPTATPAQWKALVVRDRHCQAPGCTRPPADCQAHHIEHWTRGGPTNLANLQLLCWHHHRQRHIEDAKARADEPIHRLAGHRILPRATPRSRAPTPATRRRRV
jgi:hypothetical protein